MYAFKPNIHTRGSKCTLMQSGIEPLTFFLADSLFLLAPFSCRRRLCDEQILAQKHKISSFQHIFKGLKHVSILTSYKRGNTPVFFSQPVSRVDHCFVFNRQIEHRFKLSSSISSFPFMKDEKESLKHICLALRAVFRASNSMLSGYWETFWKRLIMLPVALDFYSWTLLD